jgi:hypothetical protein
MSSEVPEVREVGCIGVKNKILPGRDSFEGSYSLYKDFNFDMRAGSTVLDNLGHSLADIKYTHCFKKHYQKTQLTRQRLKRTPVCLTSIHLDSYNSIRM